VICTPSFTAVIRYLSTAAESPLQEGLIWVGSDDGQLHITKDGGANWTDITSSNMPKYLMINSIDPSPFDEGTCYIAGTMYKSGDYSPYLYKTNNYGKTWTAITTGIPNDHFTRVVRSDKSKQGYLYAGGESGMYISRNDGKTWESLQLNLPIVPITDLAVKGDHLIAATQGRGLWMIDDLHILRQAESKKNKGNFLYAPDISYRISGSAPKDPKGSGINHPGGVNIHFYMDSYDDKKDTVAISYILGKDTIATYSTHTDQKDFKLKDLKQGDNKHRWNMRYPTAKKFDGMVLWWGSTDGAMVAPGEYKASFSVNGQNMSTNFVIAKNPNSEQSVTDIESQVSFVQSINDKVTEAHQAIIDIRSLRKQMKDYVGKINDEDLKAESEKIDSLMTLVEEALYQTKNRSGQDPLNFPIRLTNKLAHLNSLTQMGTNDYPPTSAAIAVRDELVGAIDNHLINWVEVKNKMIPAFNQLVKEKALDVIILD